MGWNVQKHLHSHSIFLLCSECPNNQSSIDPVGIGDVGLTNHLVAMVFGAVTNAFKEPHLSILSLFEHQMKWWTSQVNYLAVVLRKSNHLTPDPDAISRHGQMLPVNCFAAGEASVGIFTTVSLWVFLPQSVGNVYTRGCWPTLGSIAPFVYLQVRHRHALTCVRMNGIKHWE